LIEGLVALAFLSPWPAWLWQQRDWWLILFIVTTYTVIPVFAFAAILLLMGLAQCPLHHQRRAQVYLSLLLLIPVWLPLPQGIFSLLRGLS